MNDRTRGTSYLTDMMNVGQMWADEAARRARVTGCPDAEAEWLWAETSVCAARLGRRAFDRLWLTEILHAALHDADPFTTPAALGFRGQA